MSAQEVRFTELEVHLAEMIADQHGIAALLDHLGLDGLGNQVRDLQATAALVRGEDLMDGPPADGVEAWWVATAREDARKTAPKTEEYSGAGGGSADLRIMGDALAELCGMHEAPDAVKQELACWFYALGKVSRLVSDYKQGRPGKPDTWFDLGVYTMMARRLQETGQWP